MCQISSLMAAAEGPVTEFSSFANFEERKRKSNFLMSFPKIVSQMGSFGQIRKKSLLRFCRPTLDIFGFMLLRVVLAQVLFCVSRFLKLYADFFEILNCITFYLYAITCINSTELVNEFTTEDDR